MDESLIEVAKAGNVKEFYKLIEGDGNLLRRIDDVEFTDTPLHIAAGKGWIDFAMEIMNLKPSFAWKLNKQGLSPIHLAVKNGHKQLVLRVLELNKDLVRVKGKKGKTPLHYLSKAENFDINFLREFLEVCPECIRDVTTKNQTALHIAVKKGKLDVLKVLILTLRKTDFCREVVNRKDKDGNTALHLAAASNNQQGHKMIKLLLKCKADKHATDQAGLSALQVAKQNNNPDRESIKILRGCFIPGVSNFNYMLKKQIVKYVSKASAIIFRDMDSISSEDRNALLVILGLLLTATFQASLSPPGSVWQGGDSSDHSNSAGDENVAGKSVMDELNFLFFYIPTYAVFIVTFFLTLALLKPFPRGFRTALQVLLAFLAICFDQSITFLAPSHLASVVLQTFSVLVFIMMMFMSISYRVSTTSVLIFGWWLLPTFFVGGVEVCGVLVWFLFLFRYNDFWKGTILALGNCFFFIGAVGGQVLSLNLGINLGCWLLLSFFPKFFSLYCGQNCPL